MLALWLLVAAQSCFIAFLMNEQLKTSREIRLLDRRQGTHSESIGLAHRRLDRRESHDRASRQVLYTVARINGDFNPHIN